MGFYIETGSSSEKAAWLLKNHNAIITRCPASFDDIPSDKGLICVVDNYIFEAAAYCFSESELRDFSDWTDHRPKKWLLIDKDVAEMLSGYKTRGT